ncbi:hypothetical protein LOZ66_005657 [Ophidiomyces ophidiicola]|nr:hypothetical protein LOZ65_006614 [Ophidiomyces ophidiicola]KAI1934801.1 hypothetical protein LOZ66_005657 [Ophidiomyces ophidiicola]
MATLSSDVIALIGKYSLRALNRLHDLLEDMEQPRLEPYDGAADDPDTGQMILSKVLIALMDEKAAYHLRPPVSNLNIASELSRLFTHLQEGNFSFSSYQPLLELIKQKASDVEIWQAVFELITTVTRANRLTPAPTSSLAEPQTPRSRNTSSLPNSSERRTNIDPLLKGELSGQLHPDIPGFCDAYFGDIDGLDVAAAAVLESCKTSDGPLFSDEGGWKDWPDTADEKSVLNWLTGIIDQFVLFAKDHDPDVTLVRRPLAQPAKPIDGSVAKRKLDIGFVEDVDSTPDKRYEWSEILIPGELKNNRDYDAPSGARLDLARYVREIFSAQDERRFVLGFTLCGPLLRVWEFDRCGGIGSEQININKDGLQFVMVILGFLLMSRPQLGFDPTVFTNEGSRYIEIKKDNDKREQLVIDKLILRARGISCRGTTCWKVHHEDEPNTPLVVKDSWQYPERDEEGGLLQHAMESGVTNIARYYHHETIQVNKEIDDIQTIRKGLTSSTQLSKQDNNQAGLQRSKSSRGRSSHSVVLGKKRSSDAVAFTAPHRKRHKSVSPMKQSAADKPSNRVHRRVVVRDYGIPIYKSSSKVALLAGLEGCIVGYESLYLKAGLIQSDISPWNLLVNEDADNPSWPAFLIDLDLAIQVERKISSGARGKTGTLAFMAIGVLYGEKHSYMHDLESFFWVLFWICIHYNGPENKSKVTDFEDWNYMSTEKLANTKKGIISDEGDFLKIAEDNFTLFYQPLVRWTNKLRRIVFPDRERWKKENPQLAEHMRRILQEARKDASVID